MLKLIRVDSLRRVHNVGFLVERLILVIAHSFRANMSVIPVLFMLTLNPQRQEPSPGSSVGSDAGCQTRGCEFESQLGQQSFRRLTKVTVTCVIRLSQMDYV